MFYLAQIGYGYYHECDVEDGRSFFIDDFEDYCAKYGEHFTRDVWKQYYSLEFLLQPVTAGFWRLPNLRDLPSSCYPMGILRDKPPCHSTKLPRWADNVVGTYYRQATLPEDTITQIAIDTLRGTISRLRESHPEVPPFSETQARFWLQYTRKHLPFSGGPNYFGIFVAQGGYDMWAWERHYSAERWHAVSDVALEPDLDGTAKPAFGWCGWPDGGIGPEAVLRGWAPELGSEEEVEFMAAVAAKETEGCAMDSLDYSIRSHMLIGVLELAFVSETQRSERVAKLKQHIIEKGRLNEANADEWIQNVLEVMEPYALLQQVFPAKDEGRTALLRRILAENGQLFARGGWKFSKRGPAHGLKFDLAVPMAKMNKDQ